MEQWLQLEGNISHIPLFIGPETYGFDNALNGEEFPMEDYLANFIFPHKFYGWAHHLYEGNIASNPDALNDQMTLFNDHNSHKPTFITEYVNDNTLSPWKRMYNFAKVMHNALTIEEAAAFMYKNLYSIDGTGLIDFPNDVSFEISP